MYFVLPFAVIATVISLAAGPIPDSSLVLTPLEGADRDMSAMSCSWTISGTAWDNAGAPVQGAEVTTSPVSISPAISGSDGAYAACVNAGAPTYSARVAKAGYGDLPTTTFTNTEDARVDFVLPPADNVVVNWGFETGSLAPDWQTSGLAPAVVTSALRHTGDHAACLGQPVPAFTTPTNVSNSPVYGQHWLHLAPDGTGGVHMFWRQGRRGSASPAYYAWRAGDGKWIVPPEPIPLAGEGIWLAFAVGPDEAAHVVGSQVGNGGLSRIVYVTRLPGETWSVPLALSADYPNAYFSGLEGTPQIAVTADNTVRVAWLWHLEFLSPVYRLLLASRDASGSWGAPQDMTDFDISYSTPKMVLDQAGGIHVIWSNSNGDTKYVCRSATGPWSRQIVIRHSGGDESELAAGADGRVHVVWADNASYNIWYVQGSCQGTWSTPEAIPGRGLGYPPSLAVDRTGIVHMLWTEWVNPMKLQYARRLKAGSWSVPQRLAGVPSYNNPRLALDDSGTVHVVWAGGITGWEPTTMQVYYTSRQGDATWSGPRNISNAAQWLALYNDIQALAVEGNGRVHVGWSNGTNEVLDVYYASSAPAQQTGDSTLSQTITVPVGSAHPLLSFMYELGGASLIAGSSFDVAINDGIVTTTLSTETDNAGWTHRWFDLQSWAGQTVTLTFTLHQVAGQQSSWACLDEVTVGSAHPDTWVNHSGLGTVAPGQQIVDVIGYGNRGGVGASNGQVTMQLPLGLTFVSADPPPSELSPALRWDVGDLAAQGDPHMISATLQVLPSVPAATTLTITAAITSDTAELERVNNSDQTSVSIVHRMHVPVVARGWALPMCLLYSDDFSNPASGWPINDTPYYSDGYLNGEYRIVVKDRATNWLWVGSDFGSNEYRVEVDARAASNLDGGVGLVFGSLDSPRDFFLFSVSNGWFGLWHHESVGKWTAFIDWKPSAALRTGTQTNRLGMAPGSDGIALYANGQYIGGTEMLRYGGSVIGLWAERYSRDFDGRFDNFAVYTKTCIEASTLAASRLTISVKSGD